MELKPSFTGLGPHAWFIGLEYPIAFRQEIEDLITGVSPDSSIKVNEQLAGAIDLEYDIDISGTKLEKILFATTAEHSKEIQQFGIGPTSPLFNLKEFTWYTSDIPDIGSASSAWINFQAKHEYNPPHTHSGDFSYVLFYKIPYTRESEKAAGPGKDSNVEDSHGMFNFLHMIDPQSPNNRQHIAQAPIKTDTDEEWQLMIFPSTLMHYVTPFYSSDEYRITLSGNFSQKTYL